MLDCNLPPSCALNSHTSTVSHVRRFKHMAAIDKRRVKKLINDPKDIVEEAVEGMLLSHPKTLTRLEGLHVILRTDFDALKSKQIALISGGGSGHEPAHCGFVADGMLTAAVLGGVFASPSVASILAAIRAVTGPRGSLLIVKRYTGDLLNFGMAREQALSEGMHVEMVVVADDCALSPSKGITGRRGVAGTVLVHKIAGAAAAAGLPLLDVKREAEEAIANMGSLGLALSVCTVPGSEPSVRLDGDTIEMGMGIHGEEGIERMPLSPVNALVERMVRIIVSTEENGGHGYLPLSPHQDIALLVNNMGATPAIELSLVVRRAVKVLEEPPILARVCRIFVGPFMTSLEMAGVSITILRVQTQTLARLDASSTAPGWLSAEKRNPDVKRGPVPVPLPPEIDAGSTCEQAAHGQQMLPCDVWAQYLASSQAVARALIQAKQELNDLDAIGGDGDCGVTLERGARAVLSLCSSESDMTPPPNASTFVTSLANAVSDSMGGTSGALLEILLRAMARSLMEEHATVPAPGEWATALQHGIERMTFYGGARPGYRTMLDALVPASEALVAREGLKRAAEAARVGAERTKKFVALAGRANYVSPSVTQGHNDPGAEAVAIAFAAMKEEL